MCPNQLDDLRNPCVSNHVVVGDGRYKQENGGICLCVKGKRGRVKTQSECKRRKRCVRKKGTGMGRD